MPNYQLSDDAALAADAAIAVIKLEKQIEQLRVKVNGLSGDIDTLTNALASFTSQLETTNSEVLDSTKQFLVESINESLAKFQSELFSKLDTKRRNLWLFGKSN